ncbi:MAG: glycosyltransferase [Phycisphaerae bacterium]|nr:glycosyltransferase [Phycisphaerae bacterium]
MVDSLDKNRVKICILTSAHLPFDARIFYKEAKTLVKAGYKVILIAQHSKEETVDGVRIVPLPTPKNRFERRTKIVWRLFRLALKEKAQIYHFHDPELIPVGIALKLFGNKVIYDVHEYYSEVIPARCELKRGFKFIRFITNVFIERIPFLIFDLLFFPTYSLEKEHNIPSKSLTLINFPNIENIKESDNSLNWETKKFDIVHLGTITFSGRMKFMLEVARELSKSKKKFKWLFLGISKDLINRVKENYSKNFVEEYIVMVERVPHFEALKYVENSRIGFNYHPYEERFLVSIPMKVFEYMMMALPVVSTALPELKKFLKNDVHASLIDSQDPVRYSEAIKSLLDNSDRALGMAVKAKRLVMEELNWENSEADKLLKAYEKLIQAGDTNDKKKTHSEC